MFGYVKIEALNNCKRDLAETRAKLESEKSTVDALVVENMLLSKEIDLLKQELVDSKASTLPDSRFNISKAVVLLTTKLSNKALAKFLFELVEELGRSKESHLVTLNNYLLRELTKQK
jgi:hypothetical protein